MASQLRHRGSHSVPLTHIQSRPLCAFRRFVPPGFFWIRSSRASSHKIFKWRRSTFHHDLTKAVNTGVLMPNSGRAPSAGGNEVVRKAEPSEASSANVNFCFARFGVWRPRLVVIIHLWEIGRTTWRFHYHYLGVRIRISNNCRVVDMRPLVDASTQYACEGLHATWKSWPPVGSAKAPWPSGIVSQRHQSFGFKSLFFGEDEQLSIDLTAWLLQRVT